MSVKISFVLLQGNWVLGPTLKWLEDNVNKWLPRAVGNSRPSRFNFWLFRVVWTGNKSKTNLDWASWRMDWQLWMKSELEGEGEMSILKLSWQEGWWPKAKPVVWICQKLDWIQNRRTWEPIEMWIWHFCAAAATGPAMTQDCLALMARSQSDGSGLSGLIEVYT